MIGMIVSALMIVAGLGLLGYALFGSRKAKAGENHGKSEGEPAPQTPPTAAAAT